MTEKAYVTGVQSRPLAELGIRIDALAIKSQPQEACFENNTNFHSSVITLGTKILKTYLGHVFYSKHLKVEPLKRASLQRQSRLVETKREKSFWHQESLCRVIYL